MNFGGIGLLEVMVVLLVAFLALGPGRSVSTARTAGKVLNDLRRTFNEVAAVVSMEQTESSVPRWDPPLSEPEKEPPPKAGDE